VKIGLLLAMTIPCVLLGGCSNGAREVPVTQASATKTPTNNTLPNVAANIANANMHRSPEQVSNVEYPAAGGRRVPPARTVPLGTPPPLEFRKGLENSQIATTMNADGQAVEVRVFKDHPQLARVEATWLGPKEKLVRITLRNGSTVEVHTDQLPNLATAMAKQLVQLAGAAK
jgi:hypothetical protein